MQRKLAGALASTIAAALIAVASPGAAQVAQAAPAVDVPCSATALASDMSSASSGETLSLAPGCLYSLTAALPVINQDLSIVGNGATLERSMTPGTPAFTILQVDAGTVAVSGLSFSNGRGAIVVNGIGNVTVRGGTFTGNTAAEGGAIDDTSVLAGMTVTGATFVGNKATAGGAIFDFSAAGSTLTDSRFYGNHAVYGGAIYTDSDIQTSLSGVVIEGNSAFAGGGIYNVTNVAVMNSVISGNRASGQGGGLNNAGTRSSFTAVNGTIFSGNRAQNGAGIYNSDGDASFTNDAIVGNHASASGGGIYNAGDRRRELGNLNLTGSEISRNHADAHGGGIFNNGGVVAAVSTRIVRNTAAAGGGIGTYGAVIVTLTGSPVTGNTPDNCEPPDSIPGCVG